MKLKLTSIVVGLSFVLQAVTCVGSPARAETRVGPCVAPASVLAAALADVTPVAQLRQICHSADAVNTSTDVLVDEPGRNPESTVKLKEPFPDGIRLFRAPFTTAFDFVTARAVTHVFPGAEIEKYAYSASEMTRIPSGKVGFWVNAANLVARFVSAIGSPTVGVLAENVYCVSRDTVFTVEVVPQHSVTVAVAEGTVDIARATSIRLVAEKLAIDGIRDSEAIGAGQTVTYPVPSPVRAFANAGEARSYFLARLQAALAANDRPRIEDWTFDLRRLADFAPVAIELPAHKSSPSALPYIAAGLLVLIPIFASHNGSSAATPGAQTVALPVAAPAPVPIAAPAPVPGTISLTGFRLRPLSR